MVISGAGIGDQFIHRDVYHEPGRGRDENPHHLGGDVLEDVTGNEEAHHNGNRRQARKQKGASPISGGVKIRGRCADSLRNVVDGNGQGDNDGGLDIGHGPAGDGHALWKVVQKNPDEQIDRGPLQVAPLLLVAQTGMEVGQEPVQPVHDQGTGQQSHDATGDGRKMNAFRNELHKGNGQHHSGGETEHAADIDKRWPAHDSDHRADDGTGKCDDHDEGDWIHPLSSPLPVPPMGGRSLSDRSP